jgi:hypothetical protein
MLAFLAALAFISIEGAAAADPICPGSTTSLSSTNWTADPSLGCTVVEDQLANFDCTSGINHLKGQLQYRVCKNGGGTLDFYYRVMNDGASTVSVNEVSSLDWTTAPCPVDVNWRSDGLGTFYPKTATRSQDAKNITFAFDGGIGPVAPGSDSRFFFVRSARTAYGASGSVFIAAVGIRCSIGSTYRPM